MLSSRRRSPSPGAPGRRAVLAAALTLAALPAGQAAEAWPSRPIRLVVPYAAGGTTDLLARLVADWLGSRLGQPVIVENRGGAGATIGAAAVAQAVPDGHTLLLSNSGSHGISPHLYPNSGYDPVRDFTHVALLAQTPHVLLVNPNDPARRLAEFVARVRREGEMRFAVSGIGASAHLLGIRLGLAIGVRTEAVAYRGAGPAAADVVAGVVPTLFDSVPSGAGHVSAGTLRALATSGLERSAALPDIPTLHEAGIDVVSSSWFGLSGPRGLPGSTMQRLAAEVAKMRADPDVAGRLAALGSELPASAWVEYAAFVVSELRVWGGVVRTAGLRPVNANQ